eukprot:1860949-Rhodomonas_salina.2
MRGTWRKAAMSASLKASCHGPHHGITANLNSHQRQFRRLCVPKLTAALLPLGIPPRLKKSQQLFTSQPPKPYGKTALRVGIV